MAAFGPDDIWAVGGYVFNPQTSTLAHYDGAGWTRIDSPAALPLYAVALGDDGTGWAASVNIGSDILRFDGTGWSAEAPPTSDANIVALSRDPDGAVWMLGETADADSLAMKYDCACVADVDGDGSVGMTDLVDVLIEWGPCPTSCISDLNDDGVVGVTDLLMILTDWGSC